MKRNDLEEKKKKTGSNQRVPLVITYSKALPDIRTILRKYEYLLHRSECMEKVFEKNPLLAYRRDTNIGDILVHGKTNKAL